MEAEDEWINNFVFFATKIVALGSFISPCPSRDFWLVLSSNLKVGKHVGGGRKEKGGELDLRGGIEVGNKISRLCFGGRRKV